MPRTDLAISFFTFLTVLADLAVAGLVVLGLTARSSRRARPRRPGAGDLVRSELAAGRLTAAWIVAVIATAGSLYFSEVAGFVPCRLCWVQRAFMYPLTVILALAVVPRWRAWSRRLGLVAACAGAVVASYHLMVERFPSLESGTCDPDVPCSLVWFERLGFVTLPFMALSAFLLIAGLILASPSPAPGPNATPPARETVPAEPEATS